MKNNSFGWLDVQECLSKALEQSQDVHMRTIMGLGYFQHPAESRKAKAKLEWRIDRAEEGRLNSLTSTWRINVWNDIVDYEAARLRFLARRKKGVVHETNQAEGPSTAQPPFQSRPYEPSIRPPQGAGLVPPSPDQQWAGSRSGKRSSGEMTASQELSPSSKRRSYSSQSAMSSPAMSRPPSAAGGGYGRREPRDYQNFAIDPSLLMVSPQTQYTGYGHQFQQQLGGETYSHPPRQAAFAYDGQPSGVASGGYGGAMFTPAQQYLTPELGSGYQTTNTYSTNTGGHQYGSTDTSPSASQYQRSTAVGRGHHTSHYSTDTGGYQDGGTGASPTVARSQTSQSLGQSYQTSQSPTMPTMTPTAFNPFDFMESQPGSSSGGRGYQTSLATTSPALSTTGVDPFEFEDTSDGLNSLAGWLTDEEEMMRSTEPY